MFLGCTSLPKTASTIPFGQEEILGKVRCSVVVPLYNKVQYIRRALESILAQTFGDFEVVVVDDGSTDGSGGVVTEMNDPRIRLIRQENAGASAARNRGIAEARADLIAFLDADDEWDPGFLQAVVALADRFPEAGLLATGYRTLYKRNLVIETTLVAPTGRETQLLVNDYFRRAQCAFIVWTSAAAVRRSTFESVGAFLEDKTIGTDEDIELWGRIALRYPIAYDVRILATYHCEITGQRSRDLKQSYRFPAFVRTTRAAIQRGDVPNPILREVQEYNNRLLLNYANLIIAAGDRSELRRLLREDLSNTLVFRGEVAGLRLMSTILPMRLLYLLRRFQYSRWGSVHSFNTERNGVIRRIGRKASK